MSLSFDSFAKAYVITMKNELTHTTQLGTDIFGNIQRLDNLLDFMGERLQDAENLLENTRAQLESAKAEVAKPFPQEEELRTKTARLEERGPNAGSFDINCIRTSMDADCILLFRTEVQSYQEGLSSF